MFDFIFGMPGINQKKNLRENDTYHVDPGIANTKAKVYLQWGSKEPDALKSYKVLKKHLKKYNEEIMKGLWIWRFLFKTSRGNVYKK